MNLLIIFILFFYFETSDSAKPLQIPHKNATKFELNFVVDWKMTMTWYNESTGAGTLLKYNVNHGKYFINTVEPESGSSESSESDEKKEGKKSKSKSKEREKRAKSKSKSKEEKSEEKEEEDECLSKYKEIPQSKRHYLEHVITGDGTRRRMIMINSQVPAPTIVVPFGSEIIIKVSNHLTMEGISVHFHGIDKKNHWFMDGTARLQQCPIGSGNDFTYKFKADVAGTHFYHGHLGMDRTEGLYGAIIVMPEDRNVTLHDNTKIIPDVEYVVTLFDWTVASTMDTWYHGQWKTKRFILGSKKNGCLKRSKMMDGTVIGGTYPLSAITINDKGWYNQEDIIHRPHQLDLDTFKVEEGGKTYLFRVINAGQSHPFMISIEEHKIEVVSSDGALIRGVPADFLILYPGERYDFVLTSKDKPERDIYYLIVETLDYDSKDQEVDPYYTLAKIQYGQKLINKVTHQPDLKQIQRCTSNSMCIVVNCPFPVFPSNLNKSCVNIENLENIGPIQKQVLKQSYDPEKDRYEEYFINMNYEEVTNGWRFRYPKGPPYFYPGNESLVMGTCTKDNWKGVRNSWCTYTLNITLGNVVQLVIFNIFGHEGNNEKEGYHHPVHLHGSHFYVVKVGYAGYNKTTGALETSNPDVTCTSVEKEDCIHPTWADSSWLNGNIPNMNLKNPVLKDTVLVPLGGYVVLRFKADNPGWWVFHCHIMEHHMAGMAFALQVGEQKEMPKPPSSFPRCGVFDGFS